MTPDEAEMFPLHSVWMREYTDNHWVVFYVCEVNSGFHVDEGRRTARILAKEDPNSQTSKRVLETFRFDPSWPFGRRCTRIA
jgi:hypothetical protein